MNSNLVTIPGDHCAFSFKQTWIDLLQVSSTFARAYLVAKLPRRKTFEPNGTQSCAQRTDAFAIAPDWTGFLNHASTAIAKCSDLL